MRKRSLLALMILLCLLLTGCYAFDSESFYALPKRSEQFSELQAAAEAAMNGGEYSAPVSGSNRQAVQQADLDGDGTDEALVFCKTGVSMPLKVLILKRNDSSYRYLSTVERDGTAFDCVQYAEMDGAPGLELILSRRIGEQVQQYLGVYTLDNGAAVELLSVRCSPGCMPPRLTVSTRIRFRNFTSCPTALHILRSCRFRPCVSTTEKV